MGLFNVAFLTGEYPPMQGGIADHTAYLAQHLRPLNIQPTIVISRRWQTVKPTCHASVQPTFYFVPNWGGRCWLYLSHYLKTYRPDILHIQYQAAAFNLAGWVNWLPWYLKKRGFPTRLVTTFHDLRIPYIFPKAGRFRWASMLALARYSDGVICTNREDLHTLTQNLPNLTGRHIPLGSNIELQPFSEVDRARWRQKYGLTESTLLLAYFGFLNESKGGEELIESLAWLRQQGVDARLLLIGGDVGHADPNNAIYAQRVQSLIDQAHLREVVYSTGYISLSEVSANLQAADVVVLPYRDGVSFRRTTLIAALQHGCPIVTTYPTNPALSPEIRNGENMLLAPPRQVEPLAKAILHLAQDPVLRQSLSHGAKVLGKLFDWSAIARDTANLYLSPPP